MFGFVSASFQELTPQQRSRYGGIYCGICRCIGRQSSQLARMGLQYDMAFLALLLMSLYEPGEQTGRLHCACHPFRSRNWVENEYVQYAADMNVMLAYYKCLDDRQDDRSLAAGAMAKLLAPAVERIAGAYPRQWAAVGDCMAELSRLEQEGCSNPDEPAGVFGRLMGQLLVYREDLWQAYLEPMGMALGRFVYLADAAMDYAADRKKNRYNPLRASFPQEDWEQWEQYLVLAMSRCTEYYEKLPLVQDKDILDNILYSGVWTGFKGKGRKEETHGSV